jgi:hypothetical protein
MTAFNESFGGDAEITGGFIEGAIFALEFGEGGFEAGDFGLEFEEGIVLGLGEGDAAVFVDLDFVEPVGGTGEVAGFGKEVGGVVSEGDAGAGGGFAGDALDDGGDEALGSERGVHE